MLCHTFIILLVMKSVLVCSCNCLYLLGFKKRAASRCSQIFVSVSNIPVSGKENILLEL